MSDGFEANPEAMREFAGVFAEEQGGQFEKHMAAIAEDLGKLSEKLAAIGGQIAQGADLTVQAESSGLGMVKAIEVDTRGAE
jgi:uncharacterized protein YukE